MTSRRWLSSSASWPSEEAISCADLRREEALEPADALDLAELRLDPLLQRAVPVLELLGLLLQLVGLLAHDGVARSPARGSCVSTSVNSRALRIASTDWWAKVCISPIRFCGEFAGRLAQHHQRTEHALLVDQRHHQHRMEAGGDRDVAQRMVGGGSRDRPSRSARPCAAASPSGLPSAVDREMARLRPILSMPIASVRLNRCLVGVIAIDQHRVGMGDLERAGGDRRQHGVEIERGGDRAADLLEHLQLVDRLREVARALLHLAFEAGIGLCELAGHAVELVGEFFQLVRGLAPRCGGRNRRRRDAARRRAAP